MTSRESLAVAAQPPMHHASAEEWGTFVGKYATNKEYRWELLRFRRQLVEHYPDLQDWFSAPLIERVGRTYEERQQRVRHNALCKVSYQARPYLVFLALRGYACFDWDWLIAIYQIRLTKIFACAGGDAGITKLVEDACTLGFARPRTVSNFHWIIHRLLLHMGDPCIEHVTDAHLIECRQALDSFARRTDIDLFYESVDQGRQTLKHYIGYLHQLHVVLYHRGQVKMEPQLNVDRSHLRVFTIHQPRMKQTLENYLSNHRLPDQPATVEGLDYAVRRFAVWLEKAHPEIETFVQVSREHVLAYAEALDSEMGVHTGKRLSVGGKRHLLSKLTQFFREVTEWGWQDAPDHFLLLEAEIPKLPVRIPRYIPDEELERLMAAIRSLDCPYQRAALLIARWSGARRGEIRRLCVNCIDSFPDGTPRLHVPTGKTYRERLIPIHDEAASAIRELQARHKGERGFQDPKTGQVTQYLFMQKGMLLSETYLFATSLKSACRATGLVTTDGKATMTPHRFRHTIGTHLARRGARFRTIQKILGHESATMSMRYIDLTDEEVRQDYEVVLGPGATLAGPGAETVRSGQLAPDEVTWIANNLYKTELELGRCLRLPQEGPCECDLYLTCAKFITSPEYAPRLRRRRKIEQELIEDALAHGWQREVERHQCTIRRLEQLLADLGEPLDGPEAPG